MGRDFNGKSLTSSLKLCSEVLWGDNLSHCTLLENSFENRKNSINFTSATFIFFCQDEKNQVMTTNIWLDQASFPDK